MRSLAPNDPNIPGEYPGFGCPAQKQMVALRGGFLKDVTEWAMFGILLGLIPFRQY